MKDINDYLLTSKVTVGQLKRWMQTKDDNSKMKIIELIHHRFYNRYIKHVQNIDSGFPKMATSCLMIETIESFKQGLKNTKDISKKMFKDFFETEETIFPGFKGIYADFYSNIRCGILHQAETTNGWRILRTGKLLDKEGKSINSTKFVNALNKSLDKYVQNLGSSDFDSKIWEYAFIKLEDICKNCKVRY